MRHGGPLSLFFGGGAFMNPSGQITLEYLPVGHSTFKMQRTHFSYPLAIRRYITLELKLKK